MDVAFNPNSVEPQILFITGAPGTGKSTQSERIQRDYHFEYINTGSLLKAEADNNSTDGQAIKEFQSKGDLCPSDLVVRVLAKAIRSCSNKKFIIDGFPRSTEQALLLEQELQVEIKGIISFEASENVIVKRMADRSKTNPNSQEETEESIKNKIHVYNEQTSKVLEYYSKLNKLYKIDANKDVNDVYKQVKAFMTPNIIFFYGPPGTGKTEVSQLLAKRMNFRCVDFEKIKQAKGCKNEIQSVNALIEYFQNQNEKNFLVNNFFESASQAKIFYDHFCAPSKVFYFNASKDLVEEHLTKYFPVQEKRDQQRAIYANFVKSRNEIVSYIKGQNSYVQININNKSRVQDLEKECYLQVAPQFYLAFEQKNQEVYNEFSNSLKSKGFTTLEIVSLAQIEATRQSKIGKELAKYSPETYPQNLLIELIRQLVFRQISTNNRFLVSQFPRSLKDIQEFEHQIGNFKFLIEFQRPGEQEEVDPSNHSLTAQSYFYTQGKYIGLTENSLDELSLYTDIQSNYGFVCGNAMSGKTSVCKNLQAKAGFELVDCEKITEMLKVKLGTEDGPLEELSFDKLADYLASQCKSSSSTLLFDGWSYSPKDLQTLILKAGAPKFTLALNLSKENVTKNYKKKGEIEELTEEDNEKINGLFNAHEETVKSFQDYAQKSSYTNHYNVDANKSLNVVLRDTENLFYKNIICCNITSEKHRQAYSNFLANVCTKHNINFIDVRNVIESQITNNQSFADELNTQYSMRWTDLPINYPSNYTPELIVRLVKYQLSQFKNQPRQCLIFGYPAADSSVSRKQNETFFPRVLDEVNTLENEFGPLKASLLIADEYVNEEYNDPIQPKVVQQEAEVVVKQSAEGEEDAPAEEDGEVKKVAYRPQDYDWSLSDKRPKSLAQVYTKLRTASQVKIDLNEGGLKQLEECVKSLVQGFSEPDNGTKFVQILNSIKE